MGPIPETSSKKKADARSASGLCGAYQPVRSFRATPISASERTVVTPASSSAANLASYVLLYTPLKRLTTWNTLIGAIPGALPPLIGWAAAEGRISTLGWILFAVLFLWQMPHFFAISWTYRKEYQKGGFVMLSNADENGAAVARQSFAFAIALVVSTLLPTLLGYASLGYGAVAVITGCYLLRPAWLFLNPEKRDASARRLFTSSIFYLPALLIPLVLDLWLI